MKNGEALTDEDRNALREYDRANTEDVVRPRMTAGSYAAAEKRAKQLGVPTAAYLDHLVQREAAGELIPHSIHAAEVEKRNEEVLRLERIISDYHAQMLTNATKARAASEVADEVMRARFEFIERCISDLDFAGVPEPDPSEFLGPTEKDTTTKRDEADQ
jgi:hypothetical protein